MRPKQVAKASHGGARRGAGRPRIGKYPRCPITFSVDEETRRKIRALRQARRDFNALLEVVIDEQYSRVFGNPE